MAEHHESDFPDKLNKPSEEKKKELPEEDSDIIELSDIAIGTTPEDDLIVELTEEVIDEAMVGISGATRENFKEGEEFLDLSKSETDPDSRFKSSQGTDNQLVEIVDAVDENDLASEDLDDHITKELDDFFGTEEEAPAPAEKAISSSVALNKPVIEKADQTISPSTLVEAVEAALKKMYGDQINKFIAQVIEKVVNDEINRLKDFLTGKKQK